MARRLVTGTPDVDREILSHLDDQRLEATCGVDKYTFELCNGPAGVWRRRFTDNYVDLGPRTDYGTLYRQMRTIQNTTRWNNHIDVGRKYITFAIEKGLNELLVWALNRNNDYDYVINDVMRQLIVENLPMTMVSVLNWLQERGRPQDEQIAEWLRLAAFYDRSEIFYLLLDHYNIKLTNKLANELLEYANGKELILFQDLWPLTNREARYRAIDRAIDNGSENVIRYGLAHGIGANEQERLELIDKLADLRDSNIYQLKEENNPDGTDILSYLISITPMTQEEIYTLFIRAIGNANRYTRDSPIVILAYNLEDDILLKRAKQYLPQTIAKDLGGLPDYLLNKRKLTLSISIEKVVKDDRMYVFMALMTYKRQTMKRADFVALVTRLLHLAIENGALNVFMRLIVDDFSSVILSERELLKEAIVKNQRAIAIIIVAESPFVDDNNYDEQYRLFDSVMDEIEEEGLIRDEIGRYILDAMDRYKRTGDPYPMRWND